MKQILILFLLSFTLCCNLSAYDIFNFNTTKNGKFLTGTGADVICTTSVLLLNDNPIESATYHAGVSVISQGSVAANSTVNFKAGQTIFLLPGFHVISDGTFSAKIEDCPESSIACSTSPLELNDDPIADATYRSEVSISSQGTVAANSTVDFRAGQYISLLPNFQVANQGTFSAKIEDCPEESFDDNDTFTEEEVVVVENISENQRLLTTPLTNKHELSVYPNPFSYTTTVDFQLFEDQKVHLAIYSATQQLIKVLAPNKTMAKGNYKYEFSGADLVGGMYFVVLRTEETNLTKKLILVK